MRRYSITILALLGAPCAAFAITFYFIATSNSWVGNFYTKLWEASWRSETTRLGPRADISLLLQNIESTLEEFWAGHRSKRILKVAIERYCEERDKNSTCRILVNDYLLRKRDHQFAVRYWDLLDEKTKADLYDFPLVTNQDSLFLFSKIEGGIERWHNAWQLRVKRWLLGIGINVSDQASNVSGALQLRTPIHITTPAPLSMIWTSEQPIDCSPCYSFSSKKLGYIAVWPLNGGDLSSAWLHISGLHYVTVSPYAKADLSDAFKPNFPEIFELNSLIHLRAIK